MSVFASLLQKAAFRISNFGLSSRCETMLLKLRGMGIANGVLLTHCHCTWPHKVTLGDGVVVEHGIYFKHVGPWSPGRSMIFEKGVFIGTGVEFNIRVGIHVERDALIASGCRFIDHDHGIQGHGPIGLQHGLEAPIRIRSGAWLGSNCVVLKGVTIGKGAVVASGAVVTKNIPDYEIWGGVPAKRISVRNP